MRPSEVTNTFHQQGRAAYRSKDYNAALAYFDRAIARGELCVPLLDNRAACHEKLNNLPLALRDAKGLIKTWRDDPTGYLRAGKVLARMDKEGTALEVFSHGLRTVKRVGRGYEALRQAHADMQARIAPPKSVDPMTMLPPELAEHVLEYLTFKQRMNACMVSMAWTRFIRSVPNLWEHIDLTHAKKRVRNAFISRAINTARRKIRYATLSGKLEDLEKTVEALCTHCPLRELTVHDAGILSADLTLALDHASQIEALKLVGDTVFTFLALHDLLRHGPLTLKDIQCHDVSGEIPVIMVCNLHNLQELDLQMGETQFASLYESNLFTHTPSLKTLRIREREKCAIPFSWLDRLQLEFSDVPFLETFELEIHCRELSALVLPSTVHNLKIGMINGRSYANLSLMRFALPVLDELTLRMGGLRLEDVETLLAMDPELAELQDLVQSSNGISNTKVYRPASKLRKLGLHQNLDVPDPTRDLRRLLAHDRLSDLKELVLSVSDAQMDAVFLDQPRALKTLQVLDLSGTTITGVGLRAILQHKQLRRLVLKDCMKVGRDAIDLAVKQGVSVDYRIDGASGRKVRYVR